MVKAPYVARRVARDNVLMWSVTFCQHRSTDAQTRVHSRVIDKTETIISGEEVSRSPLQQKHRCWNLSDALFNLEQGLEARARVSELKDSETGSAVQQRSQKTELSGFFFLLSQCLWVFVWEDFVDLIGERPFSEVIIRGSVLTFHAHGITIILC